MPSSYTPQQKAQISQFVGFTSTKDSVAAKVRSSLSTISRGLTSTVKCLICSTCLLCVILTTIRLWQERLTDIFLCAASQISRMEPGASNRFVCISFSSSILLHYFPAHDWRNIFDCTNLEPRTQLATPSPFPVPRPWISPK